MKNFSTLLRRSQFTSIKNRYIFSRGKDEWESTKTHHYNATDEHVEPKDEDVIREIFDRNYYHYNHNAKVADSHDEVDKFQYLRQWQHLYITPS
jgi:hypothetical protein